MTFNIAHPLGDMVVGNADTDFAALLDELQQVDDEHGSVSVTHESEWCLSVSKAGSVSLENLEEGEPRHLLRPGRADTIAMLTELANGDLERLRQRPWVNGYPP